MTDIEAKRHQAAHQCRVIVYLATAIARIETDMLQMIAHGRMDGAIDFTGELSHRLMNTLGDVLNNMDAADDADKWMDLVFEKAREMFPLKEYADAD